MKIEKDYKLKFGIGNYVFSFFYWSVNFHMYHISIHKEKLLQEEGYLKINLLLRKFQFRLHKDTPFSRILRKTRRFGFWEIVEKPRDGRIVLP